jgi:murein DD-endopeptidase MepM/ murein hydrolase activator NlpD
MSFSGGSVHVRLANEQGQISEWMTNGYAVPVAVDAERRTTNLRALPSNRVTSFLPPGQRVQVAAWEIAERTKGWNEHTDAKTQFGDPTAKLTPYLYALPFPAGEAHRVIQGFNGTFSHNGDDAFAVDFRMPVGTSVRAARDGIVVAFNDTADSHGVTPEFKDRSRANWIVVLHDDGTLAEYWHLEPHGVRVAIGQHVARGQVIGLSGFTGHTTTPHLHFEIRNAVNGHHVRSFWFAFKTSPSDLRGEPPEDDKVYTAFE